MEKMLKLLADTEAFTQNDELSKLILAETGNELSAEQLDMVSAASGTDYARFLNRLGDLDKK